MRTRAGWRAVLALSLVGCSDFSLLPTWDTEWSFVLAQRHADHLFGPGSAVLSPGVSFDLVLPADTVALDDRLDELLGDRILSASLEVVVTKTLEVDGDYRLLVARDSASLDATDGTTIVVPFSVTAAETVTTARAAVVPAALDMLRAAARAHGIIWIQVRGRTTFPGPGQLVISPEDRIVVRVSLHATVAASQ